MGKEVPRIAVGAVVLAHGAPLPFREIGTPALPVRLSFPVFLQSEFFFGHDVSPSQGVHVPETHAFLTEASATSKLPTWMPLAGARMRRLPEIDSLLSQLNAMAVRVPD